MINWNNVIKYTVKGNPVPDRRLEKTEAEWKKSLTSEQYRITRQKVIEPAGSGSFCTSYETGKDSCVCCDTELFDSSIKFTSGTGWPNFT